MGRVIQDTEKEILTLLAQGPKTSNQVNEVLGKSREHAARLMGKLFERGLVRRDDRNKPYLYDLTDEGRRYLSGA